MSDLPILTMETVVIKGIPFSLFGQFVIDNLILKDLVSLSSLGIYFSKLANILEKL